MITKIDGTRVCHVVLVVLQLRIISNQINPDDGGLAQYTVVCSWADAQ